VLDREGHAAWHAQRKQAITAVSSSRWAGAITRAVEDQYQLGTRGLAAHVADLRAAIEVLEARYALGPGELAPANDSGEGGRGGRPRRRAWLPQRKRAIRQDSAAGGAAEASCRGSAGFGGGTA
jgi:hypothetical protein